MSYQSTWHSVVPIAEPVPTSGYYFHDSSTSTTVRGRVIEVSRLAQPAVGQADWTEPGLRARLAYQMGEVQTATIIVQNAIAEIDRWLPTSLKLFAILLYRARWFFYTGDLESAMDCYARAFDLMMAKQINGDFGSAAADLYDEWADCHMLLDRPDEAVALYQMAVLKDLACYENDPMQMSTLRLAKLAEYFSTQGDAQSSMHCLHIAQAKAESPVESVFVSRSTASYCS